MTDQATDQADIPAMIRRHLEDLDRQEHLQAMIAPIARVVAAIVLYRAAPGALSRLCTRANEAGFAVPALTRKQAAGLWRPAALLITIVTHRAASAVRASKPEQDR